MSDRFMVGGFYGHHLGSYYGMMIGGYIAPGWGHLIGAGIGGVVGFVAGGAIWELSAPDEPPSAWDGAPHNSAYTTAREGLPLFDLVGTSKMSGNIMWVGPSRKVPRVVEDDSSDKKGALGKPTDDVKESMNTQVAGYDYYQSWAVAICQGPVDTLWTVFREDDALYYARLDRPEQGWVSLSLPDMGECRIYFGTADQPSDPWMPADTHPGYRRLCYAVFNDCYIGNIPRVPTMRFSLTKRPVHDDVWPADQVVHLFDDNPAAAMYDLLVDKLGLEADLIDADSFAAAARTLQNENLLISLIMDAQRTAQSYLMDMLKHVGGVLRYEDDGRFHLKLLRRGDDPSLLPVIDQSQITRPPRIERRSWLATINRLDVHYPLRIVACTAEQIQYADGGTPYSAEVNVDCCLAKSEQSIVHASDVMSPGAMQTLSSSDGEAYKWKIASGLGDFGDGRTEAYAAEVTYYAPTENPDCQNPTIQMCCIDNGPDVVVDEIIIAVSSFSYSQAVGRFEYEGTPCQNSAASGSYCDGSSWDTGANNRIQYYDCDGLPSYLSGASCGNRTGGSGWADCSEYDRLCDLQEEEYNATTNPYGCNPKAFLGGDGWVDLYCCPRNWGDFRTVQAKTSGCCPPQLGY
jgi:hypothetical protein